MMKSDDKKNNRMRIAVLGHCNVGKSALTVRYLTRRFIGEYRSNSDLLYRQTVNVRNCQLDVEIVDVSGETRDCEFPADLVHWADACLLVYSITDKESFETARRLLTRLANLAAQDNNSNIKKPVLALLANKVDLEHLRLVSESEGCSAARDNNCLFAELSVAENSDEVVKVFENILMQCRSPPSNHKLSSCQLISQVLFSDNKNANPSARKFSVTKMLGSLIGKHSNNSSQPANTNGTVVVCQKSDLYRNKVLQRRQHFMAAVSL